MEMMLLNFLELVIVFVLWLFVKSVELNFLNGLMLILIDLVINLLQNKHVDFLNDLYHQLYIKI
ncbi:hypothetical protein MARPO_0048s0055 [Marchantia polymorpha]|uniref:Uncharacterized protein n=1 Tax=Marchantia polymorpha TaxID=3197 RepID=A0A2R6WYK6_MARPO|nr:hypothetical protein MARPO_0048s0055 [Marchantia polymorpha]|eukprot:PTQ38942.1 hypothetical protein MARPO_0048s0055 [Marchantia polymorpha]